jgi:hypothetical protein
MLRFITIQQGNTSDQNITLRKNHTMNQGIDFYNLSQSLAGAIFGAMIKYMERPSDSPPPLLQLRRGRAEAPAWFLVQALEFDPEPISVEKLRVRDIYASERIVFSLLELMASEKWLAPAGKGEFILAPAGRAIQDDLKARRTAALSKVELPLETAELTQLDSLLARIIESSLECDDPPDNWCLYHSRNRAPARDALLLDKILHYTSDFNAFRDDAHMAAWKPLDISAYAWEAFSFVWSERANTAEDIDQQLYYRGYSLNEFTAALQDLVDRDWLTERGGSYTLTPNGIEIRETAEQQTDHYFYAPWNIMETAEILELQRLMEKLQTGLQQG